MDGGRPGHQLHMGLLHAQRQDLTAAIRSLQKAVRSGITQTERLLAQQAAVELLAEEAQRRVRLVLDPPGDLGGWPRRAEIASPAEDRWQVNLPNEFPGGYEIVISLGVLFYEGIVTDLDG